MFFYVWGGFGVLVFCFCVDLVQGIVLGLDVTVIFWERG